MKSSVAYLMAGIPEKNSAFYHAIRFSVGDPAAVVTINGNGTPQSMLILRDIEMDRARKFARVDQVFCPADFAPPEGLSGDRETATAQATAECLRRNGIQSVVADRTLPLIFADLIRASGIDVKCDLERGIIDRRAKDEQEIEHLRTSQRVTEGAIEMACRMIGRAKPNAAGVLMHEGTPLTSERVRFEIDVHLLKQGFANPPSIVAGGKQGADCHDHGHGELRTGEPIIVDIFPQSRATRYYGDCTRTVVNGEISDTLANMHAAVVAAKAAGMKATKAGVTGESVHRAVIATIQQHGFKIGLPKENDPHDYCAMVHGTGHGIGLEVHEPPLLDLKGPELVVGDALTIEPGLYSKSIGGLRVEDMVIVTADGCLNLNRLPEDLTWT
jgi:Xaa-Pro aminopeptidase